MTSDQYDVVIIGGGINGVGVAQASAAAGYKTLLLEKNTQLGLETSSRSSKLIHGGLRYLETLELSLVKESLKERSLLLKLAPDLVKLQKFNIPIFDSTSRSRFSLHTGLTLYALLSGLNKDAFYRQLKSHQWPDLDGLKTTQLKTVFQYQDAQTDDFALTHAVMASAIKLGAKYQLSSQVINVEKHPAGVSIDYQQGNHQKTIHSKVVVNASGPWVYSLNSALSLKSPIQKPELVQGAHLTFNTAINQAYYLEAPQDKRAVFLLPWNGQSLLGTTEHIYNGDPCQVKLLTQEQDYLLDVYQHYFPTHDKTIQSNMAGCRVLPSDLKNPHKRSREIILSTDNIQKPKILCMIGGKLTVYRKTADKVINILKPSLPDNKAIADTSKLHLSPTEQL